MRTEALRSGEGSGSRRCVMGLSPTRSRSAIPELAALVHHGGSAALRRTTCFVAGLQRHPWPDGRVCLLVPPRDLGGHGASPSRWLTRPVTPVGAIDALLHLGAGETHLQPECRCSAPPIRRGGDERLLTRSPTPQSCTLPSTNISSRCLVLSWSLERCPLTARAAQPSRVARREACTRSACERFGQAAA